MRRLLWKTFVVLFTLAIVAKIGEGQDCYRDYTKGVLYRGTESQGRDRRYWGSYETCQKWADTSPNSHSYTAANYPNTGLGDHNYCRNPDVNGSRTQPWCYYKDKQGWGYCWKVSECSDSNCYSVLDKGSSYSGGTSSVTVSGTKYDCLKWSDAYSKADFTDWSGLKTTVWLLGWSASNKCRNPKYIYDKPWCYYETSNGKIKNATCDISQCTGDVAVVSQTCGGNGGGSACVFPFKYNGLTFTNCTTYTRSALWCATARDSNRDVTKWGYCDCSAPTTPAATSKATVSKTTQPTTTTPKSSTTQAGTTPPPVAATTQPPTSSQVTTQSLTTEPATTQMLTTKPATTQSLTTEPVTTRMLTTMPATTQTLTTEPATTQTLTTESTTTQMSTTEPATTQTLTTKPATTQTLTTESTTSQTSTTIVPATIQEMTTESATTQSLTTEATAAATMTTTPGSTTKPTTSPALATERATTQKVATASVTARDSTTNPVTTQRATASETSSHHTPTTAKSAEKPSTEFAATASEYEITMVTVKTTKTATPRALPQQQSAPSTMIYIGAAVGGVIIMAVVVIVLVAVCRKRKSAKDRSAQHENTFIGSQTATMEVSNPVYVRSSECSTTKPTDLYASVGPLDDEKFSVVVNSAVKQAVVLSTRESQYAKDQARASVEPISIQQASRNEAFYVEPANTEEELYGQFENQRVRHIHREDLVIQRHLGSGEFGNVEKAIWRTGAINKEVAVKTLITDDKRDRVKFLREAAIMGQFLHPNIVRLEGVVKEGEPLMIVVEFMANGDMKKMLVNMGGSDGTALPVGTDKKLLRWTKDIAAGMKYLSSKKFVHRDLAARNVMLDEKLIAKIGDFGLSRDLDESNYYTVESKTKVPVRWTAPEAIGYKKYSTASDVWSFGIVLYEIWSIGKRPYGFTGNSDVVARVNEGHRLPPPPGCPKPIYSFMIDCWDPDHHKRPTFSQLLSRLNVNPTKLLVNIAKDEQIKGELGGALEDTVNMYRDLKMKYLVK